MANEVDAGVADKAKVVNETKAADEANEVDNAVEATELIRPLWPLKPIKSMRLSRLMIPLWLTGLCLGCWLFSSHSHSQNIPQSLRKWRDFLEYLTINLEA